MSAQEYNVIMSHHALFLASSHKILPRHLLPSVSSSSRQYREHPYAVFLLMPTKTPPLDATSPYEPNEQKLNRFQTLSLSGFISFDS